MTRTFTVFTAAVTQLCHAAVRNHAHSAVRERNGAWDRGNCDGGKTGAFPQPTGSEYEQRVYLQAFFLARARLVTFGVD